MREQRQKFVSMLSAHTWEHSAMSNSKGWLELELIQHINKRTINFQSSDKTKEKDFELLGVANTVQANMGELIVDKGWFKQKLLCRFLWCHLWANKGLEFSPVIDL